MQSRRDRNCHKGILSAVFTQSVENKRVKSGIKVKTHINPSRRTKQHMHEQVGTRSIFIKKKKEKEKENKRKEKSENKKK